MELYQDKRANQDDLVTLIQVAATQEPESLAQLGALIEEKVLGSHAFEEESSAKS